MLNDPLYRQIFINVMFVDDSSLESHAWFYEKTKQKWM